MSSSLDLHVASILDSATHIDSDDEDALIASLEDSPAIDAFREQRIQQLHNELSRARTQKSEGYGSYSTITDEKALMDLTTSCHLSLIHFSKSDFQRCGVMDGHLETLAKKHTDTRFLKIDVGDAPFLVTKLNVKVLPCVLGFVDGKSVERIVGFEGLGYTQDTFTTKDLEARLISSGVLIREKLKEGEGNVKWAVKKKSVAEDDEDDDWD